MTKSEYLQAYDELNNLSTRAYKVRRTSENFTDEDFLDFVETSLISAYKSGSDTVDEMLDIALALDIDLGNLEQALNLKVEDKTYKDRIVEYIEEDNATDDIQNSEEITRVIETEWHRMFNQGELDRATQIEAEVGLSIGKRWETMQDGRVRGTHNYLQSDTVPINEKFYTYDGDSALMPGGFAKAENNVNCRCWLKMVNV